MKWFFMLKERLQRHKREPLVIRTVPEDMRPDRVEPEPGSDPGQDSQTGIAVDTNFGSSGSLSLATRDEPKSNPYDTHSWELDPTQDTRQMKKVDKINRPKSKKMANNPYSTGEFRKGWGGK